MDYNIGDIVYTKKPHPCKSHQWEVIRVGADFKMKCLGCGHIVMLSRVKFEKAVKYKVENNPTESLPNVLDK